MTKLNTLDFEVLVGLEIAKKKLRFIYTYRKRIVPQEVRRAITQAWASKQATNKRTSTGASDLFPLYRYESHTVTDHDILIHLGATDYKETYGTNISNPSLAHKYGQGALGNAFAVCGVILGVDNSILLLQRSQLVHEKPGWWHTVGGHMERTRLHAFQGPNPIKALQHEIDEELPDVLPRIQSITPVCFIRPTYSHKPEICYHIKTTLRSDEMRNLPLNYEHSGCIVLPCKLEAVVDFLDNNWDSVVAGTKAALYYLCLRRFRIEDVYRDWNQPE